MSPGGTALASGQAERTVLVIDDDADQRAALAHVLSRGGYRVVAACDGQDALELLTAGLRPALIVLDLVMPRMDGWRFLERLRGSERSTVPVLVTSGDARRRPPPEADAWLEKPLDVATFSSIVARLFAGAGAHGPRG
jgi:CheY-like chemotaxis protein